MEKRVWIAFLSLLITLIIGTVGLVLTEQISIYKALYFTIETITTVGYGDVDIYTDAGHIFLVFLMVGGVGVMVNLTGLITAFLVEGRMTGVYGRRKMNKKIAQLQNHIILCGAGRVGKHILNSLRKEGAPCIVIEQKEDLANELIEEGFLVIHGDSTQDETLKKAYIAKARGLITALPEDSLNVFVTLTAKGLNPNIQVVARMDMLESERKLLRAGADKVISPATIGGLRMAMSILKPNSVDYIDTVIHDHNIEIEIEELRVDQGSCLVGKTLADSGIKEQTGAMVLAILRDEEIISNPHASVEILTGDLLIVFGLRDQLHRLEEVAASKMELKSENI